MYQTSSLLPYLHGEQCPFSINVLHSFQGQNPDLSSRSPFQVLDDSYPWCTLFSAQLVTDTGVAVHSLLLAKQKDSYSGRKDSAFPRSNQHIESAWRSFYRRLGSESIHPPLYRLAAQTDSEGRMLPFAPLFFCQRSNRFFQPPCPTCGQLLELCTEEILLESQGLPQYGTSLERYLYCPACVRREANPLFYAFAPSRDHPRCVQDRFQLISSFGSLQKEPSTAHSLPCTQCPDLSSCFSHGAYSAPPIVPFGFYPFFLLCFDQPTLRADDFVSLLSGAKPAQVAEGHKKQGSWFGAVRLEQAMLQFPGQWFIYPEGEQRFLEVLFLKWSLLREVFERLFSNNAFQDPDEPQGSLDLSSWWIKLEPTAKALPLMWSYSLSHLTLLSQEEDSFLRSEMHLAQKINAYGALCFSSLVPEQEARLSGLRKAAKAEDAEGGGSVDWGAFIPPQSLFVENKESQVSPRVAAVWQESLDLGWRFLRWLPSEEAEPFVTEQDNRLQALVHNLHTALFQARSSLPGTQPSASDPLLSILDEIIAAWQLPRAEEPPQQASRETPRSATDSQEKETLLFSLEPEAKDASDEDTMSIDETRVETVFLSINDQDPFEAEESQPQSAHPSSPEPASERESEPDLERTVFVQRASLEKKANQPEETDPEATVIQRSKHQAPPPGKSQSGKGVEAAEPLASGSEGFPEEDLEKTVIQPVKKGKGERRGPGKG